MISLDEDKVDFMNADLPIRASSGEQDGNELHTRGGPDEVSEHPILGGGIESGIYPYSEVDSKPEV